MSYTKNVSVDSNCVLCSSRRIGSYVLLICFAKCTLLKYLSIKCIKSLFSPERRISWLGILVDYSRKRKVYTSAFGYRNLYLRNDTVQAILLMMVQYRAQKDNLEIVLCARHTISTTHGDFYKAACRLYNAHLTPDFLESTESQQDRGKGNERCSYRVLCVRCFR